MQLNVAFLVRRISIIIVTAFVVCWAPYYFMMITFIFLKPDETVNLNARFINLSSFFSITHAILYKCKDERRNADGHFLFRHEQRHGESIHLRRFSFMATE